MGESSPTLVLVILIIISNSANTFTKSPDLADNFFKLTPEETIEDLTIISPDQFDLQREGNNELKTSSKQFDEEDLSGSNFYMTKDIYNIKDKASPIGVSKDNYEKGSRSMANRKTENRRKFRDQYQIEEAILDTGNLDSFMKPLEDITNNEKTVRNHTKKLRNKSTDFYETLKSKPVTSSTKSQRHHLRGKSPDDFGLKHSEEPPIPDLVESTNKQYDPQEGDLNVAKLRSQLGSFYDETIMSIVKPRHDDAGFENRSEEALYQFTRNKNGRLIPKEELPDYLRDINFKFIYLSDGNRIRTRISSKLKKKMQQFLQAYTKCRIAHKWKDLGVRFWPRFFRHGYCSDGGRGSCSIPPGMTCKPSHTEYKTILRYHCKGGGSPEVKCHWRNVQYPVVTRCDCSCP